MLCIQNWRHTCTPNTDSNAYTHTHTYINTHTVTHNSVRRHIEQAMAVSMHIVRQQHCYHQVILTERSNVLLVSYVNVPAFIYDVQSLFYVMFYIHLYKRSEAMELVTGATAHAFTRKRSTHFRASCSDALCMHSTCTQFYHF